jgi:hypothetical protein
MRKSNRRLSDAERAERRRADRERLQVATETDGCEPCLHERTLAGRRPS